MSTTTNKGIDYGLGQSNRSSESGIRFGVIPANALNPDALDDVYQSGTDRDYEDYLESVKGSLRSALSDYFSDHKWDDRPKSKLDQAADDAFDAIQDRLGDNYEQGGDCTRMDYKDGNTHIQTDSSGDVWVLKSDWFTYAQFCSPCAPGACYLTNPLESPEESNKCYCLDHGWFEDGKAPYPVYSVKTGELAPMS